MDRIFIRLEEEKTTKGGIIMVESVDNPISSPRLIGKTVFGPKALISPFSSAPAIIKYSPPTSIKELSKAETNL